MRFRKLEEIVNKVCRLSEEINLETQETEKTPNSPSTITAIRTDITVKNSR